MKMFPKSLTSSTLIISSVWMSLLIVAPNAIAEDLNSLSAYVVDDSGWDPDVTLSSATGPVSYGSNSGYNGSFVGSTGFSSTGDVAGYADFGVLRAQAYSSTGAGDNVNRNASVDVETSFSVTVNAAAAPVGSGPGLVFGDNVSLNVSFRLDGILGSDAAEGDNTGSVGVGAGLTIVDPGILLDCGSSDGCFTPKLLEFKANASSVTYGSNQLTDNSWGWDLTTRNELDVLVDEQFDSENVFDIDSSGACSVAGTGTGTGHSVFCHALDFDTGILSATIETTVGSTLDINASLGIFSQAWHYSGNGAFGSADFFDTFGLVFTPITDGVELDYGSITPAEFNLGATVPVPAAVWLFGSGLIGLIGIARRKKA